jgi:DNA-binding ferritin-like protein (Dps family)
MDKYWIIAVDATGIATFSEKHCEHCLKKEYKNKDTGEVEKTLYFHFVLKAKLVIADMVFSIDSEFIENENEIYDKQDCESKAFKRLATRIKNKYPRLPICILGDSLYACDPVFDLCKELNWKYIFRFKEGRIKTLWRDYLELKKIEPNMYNDSYSWINEIPYCDNNINLVEASIVEDNVTKDFVFVTDINISQKKVERIVAAGRSRWKIENNGFNNQKNIRYDIEHQCSLNYNAMKNHYLLIQISDIIIQLFEKGYDLIRNLNYGITKISSTLLDSFRRDIITIEDISKLAKRMQIRSL